MLTLFSKLLLFLIAILSQLLLAACPRSQEPETPDVIVLHTGRIRGNVYPLSLQDIAPLQHYPYLAGYVRQVRDEAARTGAQVVLIDLGDSLEGSFSSFTTNSSNIISFFNSLRYDAILLGNLDSSIQPAILHSLQAPCLIPFEKTDGSPCIPGTSSAAKISPPNARFPVYLIANFYGDTDPALHPDRFPVSFAGQTNIRPVRNIEAQVASLEPLPPNALVLFAWLKFESPDTLPAQFLQRLSDAGIHAILAQRVYGRQKLDVWADAGPADWSPPVSQNILRNNGGFTIARLDLKRDNNSWRVLRQQIIPMTANAAPPDPEIISCIEQLAPTIRSADQPIAQSPQPYSENAILNLVLHAFASVPEASAALYTLQSIRAPLPSGSVSTSHFYRALPWNSPIALIRLSPSEIQTLLSKNPQWAFIAKNEQPSAESISLLCPEFLARIVSIQLNRDIPIQIFAESEFHFLTHFARTLAANHGGTLPILESPAPEGWSTLTPSNP